MTKSNQSEEHAMMNVRITRVLTACHWICRFEELHTDIVTFLPGRRGIWAVESERRGSAHGIHRNATRNERHGACGIVFVTESESVATSIRRIVDALPGSIRAKTVVVTIEDFTPEFVRGVMERETT